MKRNYLKFIKNIVLTAGIVLGGLMAHAQTVVYDIPLAQLVNLPNTCGTNPDYYSNTADWGIGWTSTGTTTPTSVNVQMYNGIGCSGSTSNITLNGVVQGTVTENNDCNCDPTTFSTFNVAMNGADYNPGAYNEVLVTFTNSAGLSPNAAWSGAYARVTVTYPPSFGSSVAAVTNIDSRGNWAGTYEMGNEFTVNSPIEVTYLGAYDRNQDGLPAVTPVTIWDNSGSVVAQANVPAGTAAVLDNEFRYVSITPVTLAPGTYRMSSYSTDGYSLSNSTGSATTQTEVTITTGYYNTAQGYPTTNYTGGDMFGANFYFNPVTSTGNAAVTNIDSRGTWAGTYEMGNEFTVNSPIYVTSLGCI